ncbi:hypothetical protein EXIGLDRAFT_729962 [Exidia glandulosa HHB12029]|uniref:RlpA-like protein double-psi beta-barrel domain-containing protein n=1 Tax=Exidia glandulosa HHB12029 TaxID=1314781 RepID=A0A165CD70_EXIGL|nr:hypothetical protein EXIGLDRAFT_729962 [Exidia glandulosa HHB12029]
MSLTRFAAVTLAFTALAVATPVARQLGPQTGDGTFYDVGLGSCGINSSPSENVVAVSQSVFDSFPGATANPNNNPICGQHATVSFNGKTIDVTIVDRCTGCAPGDLDFSTGAFSQLADMSAGRIHGIQWSLASDGGSAPAPAPAPASSGGGCNSVSVNAGDSCSWMISSQRTPLLALIAPTSRLDSRSAFKR